MRRILLGAVGALVLFLLAGPSPAVARTIFVNNAYTGAIEDGSATRPYRSVATAAGVAVNGDVIQIQTGSYPAPFTVNRSTSLIPSSGPVTLGIPWGRLANPGFEGQRIRATLFFAGRYMDGTGSAVPSDPYYNGCGPTANMTWCRTREPLDDYHLNWVDPLNPTSSTNRQLAVQSIVDAGLNVINMSSWGESWLPCSTVCVGGQCANQSRCRPNGPGSYICATGWEGGAPLQTSSHACDQLFDAAVGKPVLITPFIESRFLNDWDFHDEFPYTPDGTLAPGLISQIENLIQRYLQQPANSQWPSKWTRVYDQNGLDRYAIAIIQASSATIDPNDPLADQRFADGFDSMAQRILNDTGVRVGFFLDPIARDPTGDFGCGVPNFSQVRGFYGPDPPPAPQRPWFKPDPGTTGPWLRQKTSVLGIMAFSPEGWIDYAPNSGLTTPECFKLAWKRDFSSRWFATGIPFLQDVTPGYDGHIIFSPRPTWGYSTSWRNGLGGLVTDFGQAGMVYNAWNGYCEGLVGMPIKTEVPESFPTYNWLRSLTATYH